MIVLIIELSSSDTEKKQTSALDKMINRIIFSDDKPQFKRIFNICEEHYPQYYGNSIEGFCAKEGLKYQSFRRWIRGSNPNPNVLSSFIVAIKNLLLDLSKDDPNCALRIIYHLYYNGSINAFFSQHGKNEVHISTLRRYLNGKSDNEQCKSMLERWIKNELLK